MRLAEATLHDRPLYNATAEDVYDDGYLRVEHQNYYLACGGQSISLPRTEFLVMSRLVRSIERVVSPESLWESAWGSKRPLNSPSMHVYIYRLRNKLLPYNLHIDTLVNVGYRLLAPRAPVNGSPEPP
ncbi:MAG TPA: helix-turn-helix domain-containing protein [Pyrinomonadaceae bacterium]